MITFGGGDPLKYSFIYDLITYAYSLGIKCTMDTNGIAYNKDRLISILDKVNIISLPLDGYSKESHDTIRGFNGHFEKVIKILEDLNGKVKLRVNTVLNSKNVGYIDKILEILNCYEVSLWSIYEFIPLEMGSKYYSEFSLSMEDKINVENLLEHARKGLIIDYSKKDERLGNHLFVSDLGELYITDMNSYDKYLKMGSIFIQNDIDNCMMKMRNNMLRILRANKEKNYINLLSI